MTFSFLIRRAFFLLIKLSVEKLDNLQENELAEELSGQFQGDLLMTPDQMDIYQSKSMKRNGILHRKYLWNEAIVPYRISEGDYSNQSSLRLKRLLRDYF